MSEEPVWSCLHTKSEGLSTSLENQQYNYHNKERRATQRLILYDTVFSFGGNESTSYHQLHEAKDEPQQIYVSIDRKS